MRGRQSRGPCLAHLGSRVDGVPETLVLLVNADLSRTRVLISLPQAQGTGAVSGEGASRRAAATSASSSVLTTQCAGTQVLRPLLWELRLQEQSRARSSLFVVLPFGLKNSSCTSSMRRAGDVFFSLEVHPDDYRLFRLFRLCAMRLCASLSPGRAGLKHCRHLQVLSTRHRSGSAPALQRPRPPGWSHPAANSPPARRQKQLQLESRRERCWEPGPAAGAARRAAAPRLRRHGARGAAHAALSSKEVGASDSTTERFVCYE